MTHPAIVLWQTLRQVTTTELTRMGLLAGRAVQDALLDLGGGLDTDTVPAPDYVRRGLDAGAPSGLQPRVLAGSFVAYDSTPVADVSTYRLGVLAADTLADAVTPDPTLPVIARVSIAVDSIDSSSTVRNILRLPQRVVEAVAFDLARDPSAVLTVTMGTPATNPVPPSTPVGDVALWDVFVPAAAASISQANHIDLRSALRTAGERAANGARGRGLRLAKGTNALALTVSGGEVNMLGALVSFSGAISRDGSAVDLTAPGSPAFASGQVWYAYLVVPGSGSGVARGVTSRVVLVLSQVAPSSTGVPSGAISYNPMQGLVDYASGAPVYSTTRALFLGFVRVLPGTIFRVEGGILDREGAFVDRILDVATGGLFGSPHGWAKRPQFSRVDADTVRVGYGVPIHGGVPGYFAEMDATVSGSLISGAVEAPSTWYYAYVRRRLTSRQEYDLVLSITAPNDEGQLPAPESGGYVLSDYVYAGAVYNDASSNLARFRRQGMHVLWTNRIEIFAAATPPVPASVATVDVVAPSNCPAASVSVVVSWATTSGSGAWTRRVYLVAGEGIGQTTAEIIGQSGAASTAIDAGGNLALDIHLTNNRFEVAADAAGAAPAVAATVTIYQHGFFERV